MLFRRAGDTVPPLVLNFGKGLVALPICLVTSLFIEHPTLSTFSASQIWLLLASGLIGLALTDTLYLMSLNRVGTGLQGILTTSYSPFVIGLSVLFLGERLRALQIFGVLAILGAVLAVTVRRTEDAEHRTLVSGVLLALGAMATQAVSIVMIKPLLSSSPIFWTQVWRLVGGLGALLVVFAVWPSARRELQSKAYLRSWKIIVGSSFVGTYVSLLLWLAGMKFAPASIAAALNQTASLWMVLLGAALLGERLTARKVWALGLGLAGVALVTFA